MAQALVVTKLSYEHEVWNVYIGIGGGLHKCPFRVSLAGTVLLSDSRRGSCLMGSGVWVHLIVAQRQAPPCIPQRFVLPTRVL